MNDQPMNNAQPTVEQTEEVNPLLFWVAYMPGEENERKYLSDGKGNLRMYKEEGKMRDYLKDNLPLSAYERVVVHSVQGQIVLPQEETPSVREVTDTSPLLLPINTLAPATVPTALELMESYAARKPRRRRK